MKQERIYFLDYLRVIACFMVMIVHSSENFYLCPASDAPSGEMVNVVSKITSTDNLFWVSLLDGFCRISVPLFMITSAYLLCPLKPEQTWTSFFKRRALRIVPPMIVFLVLYSALPLAVSSVVMDQLLYGLDHSTVALIISEHYQQVSKQIETRLDRGATVLLSLYVLIPMLSPWLVKASARQELLIIGLFALSTTVPFFNYFGLEVFGQVFWNPYHILYPFSGYIGYLVLAHYIRFHIKWSNARRMAVGIPALAVGAAFTILSFYNQVELGVEQHPNVVEIAWVFCSPNVLLATFGFFLIISTINRPMRGYKLIEDISKKSYGMYLMHMFYLVMYAGLIIPHLHVSLAIPAIAICTFVSCYITTKIISYIPGSKWVIG